jgi:hypothetical protein
MQELKDVLWTVPEIQQEGDEGGGGGENLASVVLSCRSSWRKRETLDPGGNAKISKSENFGMFEVSFSYILRTTI